LPRPRPIVSTDLAKLPRHRPVYSWIRGRYPAFRLIPRHQR
jgi:hypothetical protein